MKFICNEEGEKEAVVLSLEELENSYYKRKFYKYSISNVSAKGYWKEGNFYICAGSAIKGNRSGHSSFSQMNKDRIKRFVENGSIVQEENYYKVVEDICTGKDSVAASLVAGGSKSGNDSWWCCSN